MVEKGGIMDCMENGADEKRYMNMKYNRCGRNGLFLPAISLGMWQNFGAENTFDKVRSMVLRAFDLGINHFDIADNYGEPPGSAEEVLGKLLKGDLNRYRDEVVISTKAGYRSWPGPLGEGGSKKHVISAIDRSLKRLGIDYVDILYSHKPDPLTPLKETMDAIAQIIRQGKALYAGVSNYDMDQTVKSIALLKEQGVPLIAHQTHYSLSLSNRQLDDGLLDLLESEGVGCLIYSPLGQGVLTGRYLDGIPDDSRAAKRDCLKEAVTGILTEKSYMRLRMLKELAMARGQTLAQMALTWVLRKKAITSVIPGASRMSQIEENVLAVKNLEFSDDELGRIDDILRSN